MLFLKCRGSEGARKSPDLFHQVEDVLGSTMKDEISILHTRRVPQNHEVSAK